MLRANKLTHFLILLKRENVPTHDIMCLYIPYLHWVGVIVLWALVSPCTACLFKRRPKAWSETRPPIISSGLPHYYNRAFYNIRTLEYRRKKQCYKDKFILDTQSYLILRINSIICYRPRTFGDTILALLTHFYVSKISH